jgi:UDP-glucose 4-epimerase
MKKYLILGGNGFIGSNIIKKLLEDKNNKILLADFNFDNVDHSNNQIECVNLDFINCDDFSCYLTDIDTVYHLISTTIPSENTSLIKEEIRDNIFPTIQLLNDMVKCNVKKIVFVSSGGCIYGNHDKSAIKEDESKNPISNYGILKEMVEKYIFLYNHYYGIDYRIIRLANPYDVTIKPGKKQGIIPILVNQILNDQEIKIWGDGEDIRDYVYIDDAINAILKIDNYDGEEKIFNVGTGHGYSINQLISVIENLVKKNYTKIRYISSRKCDVDNNVLDISRVKNCTGWEPQNNLHDGIEKVIFKEKK